MDFKGRVALITGAGSEKGIGRATAATLSKRGATVILADINGDGAEQIAENLRNDGGDAVGITIDVTDQKQVNETVEKLVEEHGKIDILLNNVCISRTNILEEQM